MMAAWVSHPARARTVPKDYQGSQVAPLFSFVQSVSEVVNRLQPNPCITCARVWAVQLRRVAI